MDALALTASAALLATSAGQPAVDPQVFSLETGALLCKATPAVEGNQRVIYLEASNQARDLQNEEILAEALEGSLDYFMKYGRLDLDHATVWQMIREQKLDPSNPYAREIGRPLDVRVTRRNGAPQVWVKAAIYRSSDPKNSIVKAADWFWESMQLDPPMVWYPSVAGSLLPGGRINRPDGSRVVKAMRWHSIGLSRNPVNATVANVSMVPLEVFCKALREGSDLAATLTALSGMAPMPDPSISKPGESPIAVKLTPERAAIIRQSIINAPPPYKVDEWLMKLAESNISPSEGMAYLIALLDGGHQLSLS